MSSKKKSFDPLTEAFTVYCCMLDILQRTGTVETAFDQYMLGNAIRNKDADKELVEIDLSVSDKLADGTLTDDDLGDYELAARRAAFYAGYYSHMFGSLSFPVDKFNSFYDSYRKNKMKQDEAKLD